MAEATNTALGEIKLAGDLAGSNNALLPELSATGVTPGQYTVPTMTVDAKGRITNVVNTAGQDIAALVPDATASQKGLVKIGSGLSVVNGTVSVNQIADATTSAKGVVQVGAGLSVSSGTISLDASTIPNATTTAKGVVQVGSGLNVDGNGLLSLDLTAIPAGSTINKGLVQVGSGIAVNTGTISVDATSLAKATTGALGVVQIGSGLSVAAGVVSVDNAALPVGTSSQKGIVQVGSNISVSNGTISVPDATTTTKGVASISGSGLTISNGVLSLNRSSYASTTFAGLVKVGTGLTIDGNGVLNVDQTSLADATTTTKGICTVGSGLNISGGIISVDPVPAATASTLGAIKVGTNLSVDGSGLLSVNYTYPDATSTTKGILKVSTANGLTISNGVLNVAQASANNFGVVSVPESGPLSIDGNGALQVAKATASTLGVVKVDGTTIVDDGYGRISVNVPGLPVASTTTKGLLQAGNGINATAGVISLAAAVSVSGTQYPGIVQVDGDTIQVNAGVISVDTSKFMLNNTYISNSKAIHCAKKTFTTATSNTNYNLDLQESNTFVVTAQGASVALGFFAPTNMSVGMTFRIILTQGSTPTTVQPTFNAAFVFPSAYTMTGNALYGDVLECTVISGSKIITKVLATNQYMIG